MQGIHQKVPCSDRYPSRIRPTIAVPRTVCNMFWIVAFFRLSGKDRNRQFPPGIRNCSLIASYMVHFQSKARTKLLQDISFCFHGSKAGWKYLLILVGVFWSQSAHFARPISAQKAKKGLISLTSFFFFSPETQESQTEASLNLLATTAFGRCCCVTIHHKDSILVPFASCFSLL